uniref:Uncharacterized protein n=1 Tax=Leptobrachium leishanense TaxID=445787 RepID=A0A8C5R9H6_9ANUR
HSSQPQIRPCCTEVQVQEPCCTEVQEPYCTEVQEPCCTEVQEPCCTEVLEPCCTEVQEPCDGSWPQPTAAQEKIGGPLLYISDCSRPEGAPWVGVLS